MNETKTCSKCKKAQSLTEFCKDRKTPDGFQRWCRSCHRKAKGSKKILMPKIEGKRYCYRCAAYKNLDEFYGTNKNPTGGSELRCKECIKKIQKDYRASNKEKVAAWEKTARRKRRKIAYRQQLRNKYGLDQEKYKSMIVSQHGLCAICGDKKKLSVDHSHKSGKVRGLLCSSCNTGLGYFKDRPLVLKKAIKYLIRHAERIPVSN